MPEKLVIILTLLVLLQLKHVIADYGLQWEYTLKNRSKYGHPGGLVHVGIHLIGSMIALLIMGTPFALLLSLLVVEGLVHYHVDWTKDTLTKRFGWTPTQRIYWVAAGTDQAVHQLTYVGMVLYWAGSVWSVGAGV